MSSYRRFDPRPTCAIDELNWKLASPIDSQLMRAIENSKLSSHRRFDLRPTCAIDELNWKLASPIDSQLMRAIEIRN